MKKILSLLLVLFVVAQVSANNVDPKSPDPKSPVGMSVVKSGTIIKLYYRGEHSGKVKVSIYNDKGAVVFKEVLNNTEHFMRPYNFAALPEGEYTIELNDETGKRYQKVTYSTPRQKTVAHLTRLNKYEKKYMLAVPNAGKQSFVVRIYNEQNQIIFEEAEKVDGSFAKMYNLNILSGTPTFEVVDAKGNSTRLSK